MNGDKVLLPIHALSECYKSRLNPLSKTRPTSPPHCAAPHTLGQFSMTMIEGLSRAAIFPILDAAHRFCADLS